MQLPVHLASGYNNIKFPFKRKACQAYRVGYGRGRIW